VLEVLAVGDVLRALEGDLDAVSCSAGSVQGCEGADLCVTRYVWEKINESITQAVDSIGIDQLVEESRKVREKNGQLSAQLCE